MKAGLAIALAVPVFLACMAGEALWSRLRRGASGYALHDTLNNLACGIGQQTLGLLSRGWTFLAYLACAELAPWRLPDAWWSFLLALVGADLCYYWFHRAAHRINLLWAGHAVHHQSEEMNLSVALRQSWFVQLAAWVFYLPLALAGVSPTLFVLANLAITLYQFWIHTELVGRLWGPLEWVLNTASHHRVHHGTNPRYLDANYGGLLIVWDRLFGTFVPEQEEVVYGTVEPLRSWDPLWANLVQPAKIWALARSCRRWRDALYAPWAPPEWRPAEQGGPLAAPPVSRGAQRKYRVAARPQSDLYVGLHFLSALALGTWLLVAAGELGWGRTAAAVLAVVATLQTLAGLSEGRAWAPPAEALRLAALCGAAVALPLAPGGRAALAAFGFGSLLALVALPIGVPPRGRAASASRSASAA